jgi:hypothetical protein
MMKKIDWLAYQQDMEGAFWLECSEEDLKEDKDAKLLYKWLAKQRKRIEKITKLEKKTLYPRTESWIRDIMWLIFA